jgi:lipopolysaccharide transport system ATP-binding protein
VADQGRTVLFVSHNMAAIQTLCEQCLLLDSGMLTKRGMSKDVISFYLHKGVENIRLKESLEDKGKSIHNEVRPIEVAIIKKDNSLTDIYVSEEFYVEFTLEILKEIRNFHLCFDFYNENSNLIFRTTSWDTFGLDGVRYKPGKYKFSCVIPSFFLNKGNYYININGQIPHNKYHFIFDNVLNFTIIDMGKDGHFKKKAGILYTSFPWTVSKLD